MQRNAASAAASATGQWASGAPPSTADAMGSQLKMMLGVQSGAQQQRQPPQAPPPQQQQQRQQAQMQQQRQAQAQPRGGGSGAGAGAGTGASTNSSSAFGSTMSNSFNTWCAAQLKNLVGNDDLTLVQFCMTLKDPGEIREYIRTYLVS